MTIALPTATARARAGKIGLGEQARPTKQQALMWQALSDDVVMEVLTYLRDTPDWFDLYKAYETMKADLSVRLGQGAQQRVGWPANKVKIFAEVANGVRHGKKSERVREKRDRKSEAVMSLLDARQFVRELFQLWLANIRIHSA